MAKIKVDKNDIVDAWKDAYELFSDFEDLSNSDLKRVKNTIRKRVENMANLLVDYVNGESKSQIKDNIQIERQDIDDASYEAEEMLLFFDTIEDPDELINNRLSLGKMAEHIMELLGKYVSDEDVAD